MKIEILRSGTQFYWRIVAGNAKILAHSETYKNRGDAERTALLVVSDAGDAEIVDETKTNQPRPPAA
jgi:uncharacterized protein YegP (UPF0339 family)